ncbi:unnamed protein product [Rotaria socialis]|uniref:Uncharacterized protein n=1 Tax=Rotaria socialis TaxID=392032 RepID=A0A817W0Z1_9BILA|nr:unnamed protein product [Rotaria socialis]
MISHQILSFRKDILKFISHLLLPIILGVFALVITLQLQQLLKQQREEDRKISALQREQDKFFNDQKYQNELLDTYINDVTALLKESNGSLTLNEVTATIVRIKTLNIFRQLDAQRNVRIIRVLHDAKQLTETQEHSALDLSTAKLCDIDFHHVATNEKQLHKLFLMGVFLSNASFINMDMKFINFTRTEFDKVDFSGSSLKYVNMSLVKFDNANFSYARLNGVIFSLSSFINADFSFVILTDSNLKSTKIEQANFSFATLENIDFSFSLLSNVDFSYSKLINVKFSFAVLENVNFSSAILVSTDLSVTKALYADFQKASCIAARFDRSMLSYSNFWRSNLKHASFHSADLTNAIFADANLYSAQFQYARITDMQLQSTLSIQDAILPNGTRAQDRNLINSGHADCKISPVDNWALLTGNVITAMSSINDTNCQFMLQTFATGATMMQRVNLSNKWDPNTWPHSQAVLSANMGSNVFIQLRGIDGIGHTHSQQKLNSTQRFVSSTLNRDIHQLEIVIKFEALANNSSKANSWCDDIKLFILYGTDLELIQGKFWKRTVSVENSDLISSISIMILSLVASETSTTTSMITAVLPAYKLFTVFNVFNDMIFDPDDAATVADIGQKLSAIINLGFQCLNDVSKAQCSLSSQRKRHTAFDYNITKISPIVLISSHTDNPRRYKVSYTVVDISKNALLPGTQAIMAIDKVPADQKLILFGFTIVSNSLVQSPFNSSFTVSTKASLKTDKRWIILIFLERMVLVLFLIGLFFCLYCNCLQREKDKPIV